MPTAANAKVDLESGVNAAGMQELTNSGDSTFFQSPVLYWSNDGAFAPVVRPDGLVTGGIISQTTSLAVDAVDVSAITLYQAGVEQTVSSATDHAVTRPSVNDFVIVSITVDNTQTLVNVPGTEGTQFSETRGAAGGPPLIPVGSVEIGQVRYSSQASAVVAASEIFQVPGSHQERFDTPIWNVIYGQENGNAGVEFVSPLGSIHTGNVPKQVYAQYNTPIFAEIQGSTDFVPAETSHSVSSTQRYNLTVGAVTETLNQGSFNALTNDGVSDLLVGRKNRITWVRFYPDRNRAAHIMTLGTVGLVRNFPADDNMTADVTISAEQESFERVS